MRHDQHLGLEILGPFQDNLGHGLKRRVQYRVELDGLRKAGHVLAVAGELACE